MTARELDEVVTRLLAIDAVCRDLSSRDKMEFLAEAYLFAAGDVRTDALITPGGFQAEQANQLADLDTMTALIRADTPDLALERLLPEQPG